VTYPAVLTEADTIARVLAGESIGRYGDGELKLMLGRDCVSQRANDALAIEMQRLLEHRTKAIMAIPRLDPNNKKNESWVKMAPKFEKFLSKKVYGSSFITRPDNAPWINTEKFFDQIESLWHGKRVTLVANGVRSLSKQFLETRGGQVDWIECPYRDAYSKIKQLYDAVLKIDNHRVILCAGPTATCLAERLALAGRHAIDLGHIGMFWRAYEENRFVFVEQREINKETNKVEPNP
jgi:hypothetical protein